MNIQKRTASILYGNIENGFRKDDNDYQFKHIQKVFVLLF
jgi:hypothetical protein